MKLELKHIAPYLPYGLKVVSSRNIVDRMLGHHMIKPNTQIVLKGLYEKDKQCYAMVHSYFFDVHIKFIKPILRPLTDLTKEIEINGDKFIPLEKLLENNHFAIKRMSKNDILEYAGIYTDVSMILFHDALLLASWHFDLFGLISQGLSIDINTI